MRCADVKVRCGKAVRIFMCAVRMFSCVVRISKCVVRTFISVVRISSCVVRISKCVVRTFISVVHIIISLFMRCADTLERCPDIMYLYSLGVFIRPLRSDAVTEIQSHSCVTVSDFLIRSTVGRISTV